MSSTTNARSEPGLSGVCCSSSGCTSVERRSPDWWCGGYGSPFTAKRTPGPSRTPPCGHPCFSRLSRWPSCQFQKSGRDDLILHAPDLTNQFALVCLFPAVCCVCHLCHKFVAFPAVAEHRQFVKQWRCRPLETYSQIHQAATHSG